ncbi:hypothetical protein MBLNU230_g2288t1 [Neophaeotheca triangularis]
MLLTILRLAYRTKLDWDALRIFITKGDLMSHQTYPPARIENPKHGLERPDVATWMKSQHNHSRPYLPMAPAETHGKIGLDFVEKLRMEMMQMMFALSEEEAASKKDTDKEPIDVAVVREFVWGDGTRVIRFFRDAAANNGVGMSAS